jgi:dihydroorotate dehydrogenase electron transfer subunit
MMQINKSAKQLLAPIVSNKKVGQYHQIIINIGDIAAFCKPGNFVAISVGGDSSRMVLASRFCDFTGLHLHNSRRNNGVNRGSTWPRK